jgi:tetratricopeptide repeat protein 21B
MLCSKEKDMIEEATGKLQEMHEKDGGKNIQAALALAQAYLLTRQSSKVKGILKVIIGGVVGGEGWSSEYAEPLERAWLLAADLNLSGKISIIGDSSSSSSSSSTATSTAIDLLSKVLKYNASCTRAYDYLGLVREKEQDFKGAAESYEKAWRYEQESNPSIGYKLAHCYLKAKRYFDAIDICHKILKKYPEYPKIKKEILEKARLNVRMV